MSKFLLLGAALTCVAALAACSPNQPSIDLGDLEDYADFLEDQGDIMPPIPFKAEPLSVTATGKVRATPDIAVITATISAEDVNESKAVNAMSEIINAVQSSLSAQDVETGFTGINSRREFDQKCRNANLVASQRHSQIQGDYWFNRRLDQRGDTETKRRADIPRVAQTVCNAQSIKVTTNMVIRIQPADAAGDALRALADAGAENARLFGYDFTDYDSLYQDAAAKAVKMARNKAETIASLSGATLGEIETFMVGTPSRTGRFGPQPNVIRPARPYQGQSGSAVDRQVRKNSKRQYGTKPPPPSMVRAAPAPEVEYSPMMMEDQIMATGSRQAAGGGGYTSGEALTETIVVQEASTELMVIPATYETVYENGVARRVVKTPASTVERSIPAVTKTIQRRSSTTNALSMSLLSGPQTIEVTANLSYAYDTPLDGKVIVEPEN